MRITTSLNYAFGYDHDCELAECQGHYCKDHRTLWQDCDTAQKGHEGSGRTVWELSDAPCCLAESRRKEARHAKLA